jgi:hypothetical protein
MQHLEGSGTPVLYVGRTVLKRLKFGPLSVNSFEGIFLAVGVSKAIPALYLTLYIHIHFIEHVTVAVTLYLCSGGCWVRILAQTPAVQFRACHSLTAIPPDRIWESTFC